MQYCYCIHNSPSGFLPHLTIAGYSELLIKNGVNVLMKFGLLSMIRMDFGRLFQKRVGLNFSDFLATSFLTRGDMMSGAWLFRVRISGTVQFAAFCAISKA